MLKKMKYGAFKTNTKKYDHIANKVLMSLFIVIIGTTRWGISVWEQIKYQMYNFELIPTD